MKLIIVLIVLLFLYLSFGIIRYYFTPANIIEGRIIQAIVAIHFILSFAAAVMFYRYLDNQFELEQSFEESNWKRIVFFLCLILSFVYIIGFLIEGLFIMTDKKYRSWRLRK